jgi:uncharacterized protein (TIGR03435 family)
MRKVVYGELRMEANRGTHSKTTGRLSFRMRCGLLITMIVAILAKGSSGVAQMNYSSTNGTFQLAYDVVSIKTNKGGGSSMNFASRVDGFTAENVSVEALLLGAYDIRGGKILNLPDWATTARYDVVAKIVSDTPKPPSSQQENLMMQQMLATRFGVKAHYEMRDGSIFDLLVGKSGIRMKEVANGSVSAGFVRNRGMIQGETMSMSSLAAELSSVVERDVVDQTGLAGRYQVHLEWTPDGYTQPEEKALDSAPPSLYTALQEQLGLRLVPGKSKVKFLVIDRISKPEPN